eukprot:COSAG06_NODE_4051_length_4630_cov_10.994262_5_plen_463_part_00
MGVAESAAADWPQELCVTCHLTRPHGWLARCCAGGLVGCVCVCVCASLVRTARKSLARVLLPIALDLSLCVSCNACCDAVCVLAAPSRSVCMGVAESAAADWPQVLCVICHLTRPHGWLARCCAGGLVGCVGGWVRLVRTGGKSLARVLTPQCFGSVCVSCNACCDAVCVHAALPPLCVRALLRELPPIGCYVSVWCDQGGAIYVGSNAQVDIRGSVLSNNHANNEIGDHVYARADSDYSLSDGAERVFILNTSFTPVEDGTASIRLEQPSGCEQYPCHASNGSDDAGFGCSYSNFSLFCTPCAVGSVSTDGRTCAVPECPPDQCLTPDQRTCIDCPRDCDGIWSTCSSDCRRDWTQTAAPSGAGAACPAAPRCAAGEDDCPSDDTAFNIELFAIIVVLFVCCAYHTNKSSAKRERAFAKLVNKQTWTFLPEQHYEDQPWHATLQKHSNRDLVHAGRWGRCC